jgi:predicted DNA-binding transcriptional regulator AlpA
MAEWITLQETADRIGVRKGTLCMWRTRDKFPFKTKGKGRSLMINASAVDAWMRTHKDDVTPGKGKKRGPKPKAMRSMIQRSGKGTEIQVMGDFSLLTVHQFVNEIKSGADVQVAPSGDGFVIKTV